LLEDNGADLYKDEDTRLPIVFASFAAVIGLAAPAQADVLAGLNNAGITYQSGPDAIGIGRRACDLMDQGHPPADVIKAMTDQDPGFTNDAAARFLEVAENTLCPQHLGGAVSAPPPPPPAEPAVPPFFPWPAPPAAL
jgi:Protein of unknown function (DUF732)